MSRRRLLSLFLLAGFAGLFFFPALIGLLTDWWWFQEIGYQVVFSRELLTRQPTMRRANTSMTKAT